MKKNKEKIFRTCFIILFVIFSTIYISNKYGYYEFQKKREVTLTEDQIRKFEQDVKDGVNIDINNYVVDINKDYQTKLSGMGLKFSNTISKVIKKGVDEFFKYIDSIVTEK